MIRILATAIFALIFCVLAFFLRTQSCAQSETFTMTPPAQETPESEESQNAEESSEATESTQDATSQEEASAEGSAQEGLEGTPNSSESASSAASSPATSTASSPAKPSVTSKERKKLDKEMKAMRKAFDKADYEEALESASELIGWLRSSGFASAERGTEEEKTYRESLKEANEIAAKAASHVEEPVIPASKATYFPF